MLDAPAPSQRNFQGIPVTEPIVDAWRAHEALTNLSIAYPGQIFTVESPIGAA